MMNTSLPRIDSLMTQLISPSLNRFVVTSSKRVFSNLATSSDNLRLAVPDSTTNLSSTEDDEDEEDEGDEDDGAEEDATSKCATAATTADTVDAADVTTVRERNKRLNTIDADGKESA